MEHDERADELEREADRLERESERLGQDTEEARREWEARKSDTAAPGAAAEEAAGPHNVDSPDPATGRRYGEERQAEVEDAEAADAEENAGNEST